MEKNMGFLVCIVVISIILLLIAIVKKAEWLLNFVMRGIMGTVGIYLVNTILIGQNIDCEVGINVVTVLTNATLGFPGFLLLYGIRLCNFL